MRRRIFIPRPEINFNKIKVFLYSLVALGVFSGCVASSREFQLSDASESLRNFENSRLNPISSQPRSIPSTGLPQYDLFFEKSNRAIVLLKMGEQVAESAFQRQSRGESIQEEMEAARILEEELPKIISDIPLIEASGKEIQKNLERDFSGTRQAQLPQVSMSLAETLANLSEYSIKAPKVITEIQRLRTDSENFAKGAGESTLGKDEDETDSAENLDRNDIDRNEDSLSSDPSSANANKSKDPKPDRKINGQELPEIRRVSGSFSPKSEKIQVRDSGEEGELTDEERREREYNQKLKAGLLDVFRSEARRDVKSLSNLTLNHSIPRVRAAGASALGRLRQGRWTLERSIQTDGFVVRSASYRALAEIGHRGSLPVFIAGLKSDEPSIQASSFLGLGKTLDPAGRELIISRGLSTDNVEVLTNSIKGLSYYRVPSDLELISRYLASESTELNTAAIEALTIHNTPESLIVLENALVEHPRLAYQILDAIGQSKELAATFFLVRASQLYEDEGILKKIGSLLLKRKAFGTYGMVVVREDRIRSVANERSTETGIVRLSDVGRINSKNNKRFVVRVGDQLMEDLYYNMTFENRIMGSKNRYSQGWIFGKKIQIIQINKPFQREPAILKNMETGRFQNLYDPGE